MKYIKSMFLAIVLGFILIPSGLVKANSNIPTPDVTYDHYNGGSIVINEDKTILIEEVYLYSQDMNLDNSPIRITNNSTVNIVIKGINVLAGDPTKYQAGIQVDEGSTVNIYGYDNSELTVYGGQNSAGIGGIGYSSVSENNPKAGNINIYSGKITAIGGNRAAGIGSGYHSSASNINILGGNITAYGNGCGAGIGSGYGTSGGSATAAKIGFYDGGNITIGGNATVKAASYNVVFDNFDPYNLETLYADGYQNNMAAGIGGGYGASGGNIIIEGSATVTAVGSSGAAGIGSGRGTPKADNFNFDAFFANITIRGNAKVMAFATDDKRQNITGEQGGAAIGLGRGVGTEERTYGKIKILENANVYAVGSYHTEAIGASNMIGKFENNYVPPIATLEELTIAPTATVVAISDGYTKAIPTDTGFISLNTASEFYEKNDNIFTASAFPLKVKVFNKDNPNTKSLYALNDDEGSNVMIQLPNTSTYNVVLNDIKNDTDDIYLGNDTETLTSDFKSGNEYDVTNLTATLDTNTYIDTSYGRLNVKIVAPAGIFALGSEFDAREITDANKTAELKKNIDSKYNKDLGNILFLDLKVMGPDGEFYGQLSDEVKIYVELPKGWDSTVLKTLFITSGDDENLTDTQKIEEIDGVKYLVFKLKHFSNYALLQYNINPNTGDDITYYVSLLEFSIIGLGVTLYIKKKKLA